MTVFNQKCLKTDEKMSSTTLSNDKSLTNPNISTHSFTLKPKPQNILIMRTLVL